MKIGTFVAADGGFAGHLHTLTLEIDLVLVPADPSDSENAPDFRVIAERDGRERAATDYVSGMTDSFAMETFSDLFIPEAWNVK